MRKKEAVVLQYKEYEELLENIEDLQDIVVSKELNLHDFPLSIIKNG